MTDERDEWQQAEDEDEAYEPPVLEPIGSAEKLAKGNEGSPIG